jgi:hypothetical protein
MIIAVIFSCLIARGRVHRMVSAKISWAYLFLTILCGTPVFAGDAIDRPALQRSCTTAAAGPVSSRVKSTVDFALTEWIRFEQGKTSESTSEHYVYDVPNVPRFAWDKIYDYWLAARAENELRLPYTVESVEKDGKSSPKVLTVHARTEIDASKAALALENQQAVLAAIRRSAVSSTPWSAVFISNIFNVNGYTKEEFEGSSAHAIYIRNTLARFSNHNDKYRFLACDPEKVKPRTGDIVCAGRNEFSINYQNLLELYDNWAVKGQNYKFESHCDIVTAVMKVRSGRNSLTSYKIETVGGNVNDSVCKKYWSTSSGFLDDKAVSVDGGPCLPDGTKKVWTTVLVHKPD